jgi:hypothetical protein
MPGRISRPQFKSRISQILYEAEILPNRPSTVSVEKQLLSRRGVFVTGTRFMYFRMQAVWSHELMSYGNLGCLLHTCTECVEPDEEVS